MVQQKAIKKKWLSLKYAFIVNKIKNENWYYQNTTQWFRQKGNQKKRLILKYNYTSGKMKQKM